MLKPLKYFLLLICMLCASEAFAQAPRLINFQAQIEGLSAGTIPITFTIFDSADGSNVIWTETQTITETDGVLQVLLGAETELPDEVFSTDGERFLELNIDGETLSPRFQLTSVAYALRSTVADQLTGGAVTSLNTLSDDVTIKAGANVVITQDGQEITIASTLEGDNGGGGITTISGSSGIEVTNPNGPIAVVSIGEDVITDTNITDDALTAQSLADNSVGNAELADGSVDSEKIEDGVVVRSINGATDAITLVGGNNVSITTDGETITFDAQGTGNGGGGIETLAAGTGITVDDTDGPISTISIAENSINDDLVADNSLSASSLGTNSVGSIEIQAGAVGNEEIANDAIDADQIQTDAVGADEIQTNAVGAAEIQANSIGSDEIQDNAVGSAELQNEIELGPSGSLALSNEANQRSAQMGAGPEGGNLLLTQTNGNFIASALTVRNNGDGVGIGGQLQLRANENWDAVHMFSDGTTQGGRLVFREPSIANPAEAVLTLALRGEDEKGHIIVLDGGSGSISIGGPQQEIRTRGKVGIGLNLSEYESDLDQGDELFVRGDATISGTLTNSANAAVMDHPQDPENMILAHSEVISSEMLTVYHGNVILDNRGEATVQLPDWFESLNKDFRYQLTCIGGWGRVYIAEKITNNSFKIAGGTNGLEVSWQITAVRNDPYAQSNPIQVETQKVPSQQGTYINPEAYGVSNDQ